MPLFSTLEAFLEKQLSGCTPQPDEPLFKIKSAKSALGSACVKLVFPRFQHHAFRRYFITAQLMAGTLPNIVAEWVGHRTSEMVMEIYASIPSQFEVNFAEKIQVMR